MLICFTQYKSMDRNLPQTTKIFGGLEEIEEEVERHLPRTTKIFEEIEEIEEEVEREYNDFKNFKVDLFPPPDHHYLNHKQYALVELIHKQSHTQRMLEEWHLLHEHIPSLIFVRAYEHRIDLMRAAFVAPPGSDYHHCLFFFDIYFPPNYPNAPPKVWYRSYGVDLNPNLGTDGRVRLNILKTWNWFGSNNKEKWNPKESNVLHVLHAIENLISHCSPESSEEHNMEAFISACEKMFRVLRKPPISFEILVEGHFRRRAHPVLLKFKENKNDETIMINLFKKMFWVFEWNGAYCKHHLDFLKQREQQITTGEEANQEHAGD